MSLNDNAAFVAAKGYVFIHDPATVTKPTPADITAFTEAEGLGPTWTDLGHTSREDLPEFGFEGGEVEARGTWRSAVLREVVTEQAADYVIVRLHQFDEEGLSLYYGVENNSETPGEFEVLDAASATTERALCIVMVDGDQKIGFYAAKASIRRDDAIEMAVDEFSILPIRATFLKPQTGGMFSWINEDIINPASASS